MNTTERTRWLDAEQQRAWRSYLGGATILQDKLDRDLREGHDLSMAEYEIMVRLSEREDHRMRMAELADAVSHSRSRMTHTVARLERAGLVRRQACADDKRGVEAMLTEDGYAKLTEAAHTHVQSVRTSLVDLATDDELQILGRVMQRVVDHLGGKPF